jgi:hypothetical protein
MSYTTITDELLAQILASLTTIAGYRIQSAAIANNGGAGTAITFATAFASDNSFELLTEARDTGGVRVEATITNVTKTGFTATPPKDCTLKYLAMLKTA